MKLLSGRILTPLASLLGALSFLAAAPAQAQAFPTKQVRVILTSQAGNVTDANTRMLANALSNL